MYSLHANAMRPALPIGCFPVMAAGLDVSCVCIGAVFPWKARGGTGKIGTMGVGGSGLAGAGTNRAGVDAYANGCAMILAGADDVLDLGFIGDVAGIQANLGDAGGNGLQGTVEMEMHVGN